MAADWYCRIAGAELGPLSSQHLKALAADGRLRAEDEVCQGKGGKWVQASRVKGLLKSPGSEVLVARPLDEDDGSSAVKSAKGRAKPASKAALPKAKSAPKPPEPSQTTVPIAKVAVVGGAPASTAPGPSPFDFKEPGGDQAKSASRKSGSLSPSDLAKHRRKQRKKMLIGSVGAVGGVFVVLAVIWIADPFGTRSGDDAAQRASAMEPIEEGELGGDLTTDLDELLGTGRPRSDAAADAAGDGQRWLDASKDTATAGPVSVRVVSAEVAKPQLTRAAGRAASPPEDYLIVTLELANTDPAKKVVHSGWGGRAAASHGVSLVDNHGNRYKARTFTGAAIDGQQSNTALYADEPVRDVLVFERPVEAAKYLRLTLPAAALEHSGMLRFQIPKEMIGAEPSEGMAAETPRRPRTRGARDDADDEDADVHRLDVAEKAVQRAAGLEPVDPDRPLSGFEKMKRDNPELFPEQ